MVSLLLVGCCPLSCMHAERGLLQGCFGLWASFISGGLYKYISYPSPEDIGAPGQHPSPGLRAPRTRASCALASARKSPPPHALRCCAALHHSPQPPCPNSAGLVAGAACRPPPVPPASHTSLSQRWLEPASRTSALAVRAAHTRRCWARTVDCP